MTNEISKAVDDILKIIEGKVERKEIESELARYLDHGVPLEEARRTILHRFGPVQKDISSLQKGDSDVSLIGRVVSINKKEVLAKGEKKTVYFGFIADRTGTISYSSFRDLSSLDLKKGDILRIEHGYVTEFQEKLRLNFGVRTVLIKEDVSKYDIPVPERMPVEAKEYKTSEIRAGARNIVLMGKIECIEEREVDTQKGRKNVYSGILADSTGRIRFSSWHDFGLKEGDVIRVEGAYAREWKGRIDINFDEKCNVTQLDKDIKVADPLRNISEIENRGWAVGARVEGVIVDVRPGSGLISRCTECNRVLQKGVCREHGEVEGKTDLRIRAVIDDGTGTINVNMGREISEKIIGRTSEECKQDAQKKLDPEVVVEYIRKKLILKSFSASGDVIRDDFGLSMIAEEVEPVRLEKKILRQRAESVLEKMGVI